MADDTKKLLDLEGLKTFYNKIDSEKQATVFEDKAELYDALTVEGALEEVMNKTNDVINELNQKVVSNGEYGAVEFNYNQGHEIHTLDLYIPGDSVYGGAGTYRLWNNTGADTFSLDYYSTEGKTFKDKPFIENLYLPDKNKQLNGDTGYLTAQQLVEKVASKADYEYASITMNDLMWYANDENYKITGDYRLIGDTCILDVTVKIKEAWNEAYYTLPVAATKYASLNVVSAKGNQVLKVTTDSQSNLSVMKITRTDGLAFAESPVSLQFIYQYK